MFFKSNKTQFEGIKLPVDYTKLTYLERRVVRNQYITNQQNKCYYCKGNLNEEVPREIQNRKITPELFPSGFFDHPIHLHHSHDSGMTIGAVHAYCNAVLWEYEDE